jgi:hypothetical protein
MARLLCVLSRNAFGEARKVGNMTCATGIGAAARVQQLLSDIAESIPPGTRARLGIRKGGNDESTRFDDSTADGVRQRICGFLQSGSRQQEARGCRDDELYEKM